MNFKQQWIHNYYQHYFSFISSATSYDNQIRRSVSSKIYTETIHQPLRVSLCRLQQIGSKGTEKPIIARKGKIEKMRREMWWQHSNRRNNNKNNTHSSTHTHTHTHTHTFPSTTSSTIIPLRHLKFKKKKTKKTKICKEYFVLSHKICFSTIKPTSYTEQT